jgi:hypothetical protein
MSFIVSKEPASQSTVTYPMLPIMPHDSADNWATINPVVVKGLIVYEDDDPEVPRFKLGDGESNYNDLPYLSFPGTATWGDIVGTLANQSDLVAALAAKASSSHTHIIGDVTGLQTALDAKASASHSHSIADVTGLQTSLDTKADLVGGLVPSAQLPSFVDDVLEFTNLAAFPVTGTTGKIYVALDTNETYRWSGSVYTRIANGAVQSVNSQTGNVTLTKSDIGLSNVPNTDATNPANIVQDSTHRFTTDAEKAAWDTAESNAKTYADGLVVGLFDDRGNHDASGSLFPSTGGSGSSGAVMKGDVWSISVAGTIQGEAFDVGDSIRALTNAPGQTLSNWARFEHNTEQATESIRGTAKVVDQATIETVASANDTDFVTTKKFWLGITKFLTQAWTFASKITFTTAPRFSSVTASEILEVDSNKDLVSASKGTAYNKNKATSSDVDNNKVVMSDDTRLSNPRSILGMSWNAGAQVNSGATVFGSFIGAASTFNATESNREHIVPIGGTLKNFYVRTSTAQHSGGTLVFTVRINGADTSIVITINANDAAGTYSETSNGGSLHTAILSAGDRIAFKAVNAAGASSATLVSPCIFVE